MLKRFAGRLNSYDLKVLSYSPIAYWPLWEASGSVAHCLVDSNQDGEHIGVTLGQPGIGDGRTSPLYDGLNAYTDIYTTTFRDAFALYNDPTGLLDESEGTVIIWAKVNGAGVWTDGANRELVVLRADAENYVRFTKRSAVGQISLYYEAGNIVEGQTVTGLTTTDWMCFGITWSKSAGGTGEVRYYFNGVQSGGTVVGLGVWIGNLDAARALIGAISTTPTNPWHGWLAHAAVWGRALTPATMADLALL